MLRGKRTGLEASSRRQHRQLAVLHAARALRKSKSHRSNWFFLLQLIQISITSSEVKKRYDVLYFCPRRVARTNNPCLDRLQTARRAKVRQHYPASITKRYIDTASKVFNITLYHVLFGNLTSTPPPAHSLRKDDCCRAHGR